MPAHFDKLERCWRSEDAQGQILGYYDSEAQALAAVAPPVDDDAALLAVAEKIDALDEADANARAEIHAYLRGYRDGRREATEAVVAECITLINEAHQRRQNAPAPSEKPLDAIEATLDVLLAALEDPAA